MGGWGSGRWQHGKRTVAAMRSIDVRRLQREGWLVSGERVEWRWPNRPEKTAVLHISVTAEHVNLSHPFQDILGEWLQSDYPVQLEWTPCHFGGRRAWFRCPEPKCNRRVAKLYAGNHFCCRHCHELTYISQRQRAHDRAFDQMFRVRDRLGWEPGLPESHGAKPKGMHWRTYWNQVAKYDRLVIASIARVSATFGLVERTLGDVQARVCRR